MAQGHSQVVLVPSAASLTKCSWCWYYSVLVPGTRTRGGERARQFGDAKRTETVHTRYFPLA